MNGWEVYLWLQLDSIIALFIFLTVIFLFMGLVFFVLSKDEIYKNDPAIYRYFKRFTILGIVFMALTTLTPSTKQATMIYVLPKIANNKRLKQASLQELQLAKKAVNTWLNKQIKENK